MTKIQEILEQQRKEIKNDSFEAVLEISLYNEKRFDEIINSIKSITGKEVWNEYSFGNISGKILGILRTLNFEFKHRETLCRELGISPLLIDMYYQYGGNAPFINKIGEVVPARPMNVTVTKELVKRVGTELNIIVTESDLNLINSDNESIRNASALQRAEDTRNNSNSFTQNINVNIAQTPSHLEGVLDA